MKFKSLLYHDQLRYKRSKIFFQRVPAILEHSNKIFSTKLLFAESEIQGLPNLNFAESEFVTPGESRLVNSGRIRNQNLDSAKSFRFRKNFDYVRGFLELRFER